MYLSPDKLVIVPTPDLTTKEHTLYFGNKALRTYEVETGERIQNAMKEGEVSFESLTRLLKNGFAAYHPTITMDDVDAIVDSLGITNLMPYVSQALTKAFPQPNTSLGNGHNPPVVAEIGNQA